MPWNTEKPLKHLKLDFTCRVYPNICKRSIYQTFLPDCRFSTVDTILLQLTLDAFFIRFNFKIFEFRLFLIDFILFLATPASFERVFDKR